LQVVLSYTSYGGVSSGLLEQNVIPVNEDFGENVTLSFEIPVADTNGFLAWVEDKTNGTARIIHGEQAFVDVAQS
jgi:putative IMPACT (imprinted ancient) family translation regulator